MNAHVGQCQTVIALEKSLPVRDRVHVDLGEDDLAEISGVNQLLEHPHRLVVTHVLVDREDLAGGGCFIAQRLCLFQRQRQRLLRQDGLHIR